MIDPNSILQDSFGYDDDGQVCAMPRSPSAQLHSMSLAPGTRYDDWPMVRESKWLTMTQERHPSHSDDTDTCRFSCNSPREQTQEVKQRTSRVAIIHICYRVGRRSTAVWIVRRGIHMPCPSARSKQSTCRSDWLTG